MAGKERKESPYLERAGFINEVKRFEAEAKADPKGYEAKCRRVVALGYFYIALVLGVMVGLIGLIVWLMVSSGRGYAAEIKIILILGIGVVGMAASLFRRLPDEDDGVSVSRDEAPRLWATVDGLCDRLQAPKIHRIRITFDWNASASQIPAFGMFGPSKNTLRYGLPLMTAESPDETRATIAHELGHFAGGHSRFAGKAYRVVQTWEAAGQSVHGAIASILIGPFLKWYLPKLWATTFPLRRISEYAADEAATQTSGAEPNACGLLRMSVQGPVVGDAFQALYDRVETEPTAPTDAVQDIVGALQAPVTREDYRLRARKALAAETDYDDTHPSLSDRLVAIGVFTAGAEDSLIDAYEKRLTTPSVPCAAHEYLGREGSERIAKLLSAEWHKEIAEGWAIRHRTVADKAKALREIDPSAYEILDPRELAANLTSSLELWGPERSAPVARALLQRDPSHAEANMVVGLLLAKERDPAAEQHLELASASPEYRAAALYELSQLAERQGRTAEAARLFDEGVRESEIAEKLSEEELGLDIGPAPRALAVEPETLAAWRAVFANSPTLKAAFAIEFDSRVRPGHVHRVLHVQPNYGTFVADETKLAIQLMQEVGSIEFAIRAILHSEGPLLKRLTQIEGAKVWGD